MTLDFHFCFSNRMKSLMFLNELDELGFQFSAEEFKNLSKPEIIRLLFKRCFNTSKSQKAVDLCFGLYIEFKIFDISISKCILDQMRKFSMVIFFRSIETLNYNLVFFFSFKLSN